MSGITESKDAILKLGIKWKSTSSTVKLPECWQPDESKDVGQRDFFFINLFIFLLWYVNLHTLHH